MDRISKLKMYIREESYPFFTDEELKAHLEANSNNVELTAYKLLIMKSEDTTLSVSGLSVADSSKYFLRLAQQHRPNHSGNLKGV